MAGLYKKFDKAGIYIKDKSIVVNAEEWKKRLYYEDVTVMQLSTGEYRVTGKRVESEFYLNQLYSRPSKDDWKRIDPSLYEVKTAKNFPWSKPVSEIHCRYSHRRKAEA